MNSVTVKSSFEIIEEGEDEDGIWCPEYGWLHLHVYIFRPFTDVTQRMAIIFLWPEYKTICFDVHCRGKIVADWPQYFYSEGSLVMTIDFIAVQIFFSRIFFHIGRTLRWMGVWTLFIVFIIFGRPWRVFGATNKRGKRGFWSFSGSSVTLWSRNIAPPATAIFACCFTDLRMLLLWFSHVASTGRWQVLWIWVIEWVGVSRVICGLGPLPTF